MKFGGFDIQGFDSSWVTVFKVSYKDASGVYKFVNDEEGNEKVNIHYNISTVL